MGTDQRKANREIESLRRMAERMRRDGRGAMAILLDNAAFLADGGELAPFDWSTRSDGGTDDVEVSKL